MDSCLFQSFQVSYFFHELEVFSTLIYDIEVCCQTQYIFTYELLYLDCGINYDVDNESYISLSFFIIFYCSSQCYAYVKWLVYGLGILFIISFLEGSLVKIKILLRYVVLEFRNCCQRSNYCKQKPSSQKFLNLEIVTRGRRIVNKNLHPKSLCGAKYIPNGTCTNFETIII